VGIVLSGENDELLKGASVTLLEGDIQTQTDDRGRFFLFDAPTGEATVRVELGGYVSVVESVGETLAGGVLQFRLSPIWASLPEIQVLANGSASASADLAVSNDDARTVLDLLADRIPGVGASVSQSPAQIGSRIRIRGNHSISFSSAPSVYLDGVRVDAYTRSGLQTLDRIPASDVAGIRVLRGPSATAQYGDAASGVILIETRGGGR
jgi:outer membrane receptor protein involved in Fe transport